LLCATTPATLHHLLCLTTRALVNTVLSNWTGCLSITERAACYDFKDLSSEHCICAWVEPNSHIEDDTHILEGEVGLCEPAYFMRGNEPLLQAPVFTYDNPNSTLGITWGVTDEVLACPGSKIAQIANCTRMDPSE
jgi:hypothetical protein